MTEWMISSSALIGAMLILRAVVKGRVNPRLQYALWAIVLVRLLCPVSFFDSGLSILNVRQKMMAHPAVQAAYQNFDVPIFADTDRNPMMPELPRESLPAQNPDVSAPATDVKENPSSGADSSVIIQTPAEDPDGVTRQVSVGDVLMMLWFGGMVLMAAWMIGCNVHFLRRLKKNRQPRSVPDSMLDVYVTDGVETPCLFGLFRPAVYLTPDTAEDPLVMEYVLIHELTHYRQFDHVWSVLRGVALVLHWYNPLAWMAFRASRQDCEMACDEGTLNRLGEAHRGDYGRTLICLATGSSLRNSLVAATTLTGGKKAIRERIVILMKHPRTALITMICLVLCCALIVGCTFTGPMSREEEKPATLSELLSDGLGDGEDFEGYFRLTELDTDTTYQRLENYLFELGGDFVLLDWENAVSDGSGLFGDAAIMVQVENADGSWYVRYHNGTDAEWIYVSQYDLYVPTVPNPDGMARTDLEAYFNTHLAMGYDSFLWRGWHQEHLDAGSAEDAVGRYWSFLAESKRRTAARSFSGNYVFEYVTLSEHSYRINDDGSVYVSCTLTFFPAEGEELKFHMIDPNQNSFTWDDTLVLLPDGNWYVKDHLNWMPEYDEEDVVQIPSGGNEDLEVTATPTELTAAQIQQVNDAFRPFIETQGDAVVLNPVCQFFTSTYASPQELDLMAFLRNFSAEGIVEDWYAQVSDEEFTALAGMEGFPFENVHRQEEMPVPVHKYEAQTVDEVIFHYTGVPLDRIPNNGVLYSETYDAYYNFTSDMGAGIFVCTGGVDYGDYVELYSDTMVLTLVKQGDRYLIYSHLPMNLDPGTELTAEQIQQVNEAFDFIRWEENGEYHMATNPVSGFFTSYYASPEEIDLEEFLRYFSAYGIVDYEDTVSEEEFWALKEIVGDEYPFLGVESYEDAMARHTPIHRIPYDAVEAVIGYYTGIPLADLTDLQDFPVVYLEEFDCFYNFTSDFGPGVFQCVGGVDYGDYVELYSANSILTLEAEGFHYYIVSHLPRE